MRNTVTCLVPGTENRSLGKQKFAPLLEYMKNPHWDISPLVKHKLHPLLANRKISPGENTSLSHNSNQYQTYQKNTKSSNAVVIEKHKLQLFL
jgi:hypothetical protein